MQSIIIIEKADGKIQSASETQVSDEVYMAMLMGLRRAGALERALMEKVNELEEAKKPQENGRRRRKKVAPRAEA